MATTNSKLYASQSYSKISDRPDFDLDVITACAHYVVTGAEADGDKINLIQLPAGAKVLPHLSILTCDNPGTFLSFEVGTDVASASYDTGLDVSAGGTFAFGAGTEGSDFISPAEYTASYNVVLTVASSSVVTAGADIMARIVYGQK